MNDLYYALILFSVIELIIFAGIYHRLMRIVLGCLLVLLGSFLYSVILFEHISLLNGWLFYVGIWKTINALRFGYGRMHERYLLQATFRTSYRLTAVALIGGALIWFVDSYQSVAVPLSLALVLMLSAVMLKTARKNTRIALREPTDIKILTGLDKPTVSVCIPARNETEDMAFCINSVLQSSYDRLEILVLDDCSHDSTPDIIKGFAHKGVRFLSGEEPSDIWLAKNQAYDKLSREALGDIILFCGVDVRFEKQSIRELVAYMEKHRLNMLSVIPRRGDKRLDTLIVQSARYLWELAVPRFFIRRPQALGTCWLIRRDKLLELGGFSSFSRSIMPERHLASRLEASYALVAATEHVAVTTVKKPAEQRFTALRTRYPQLRRRPENVSVYLMLTALLYVVPPIVFIKSLFAGSDLVTTLISGLIVGLSCLTTYMIVRSTAQKQRVTAALLTPVIACIDMMYTVYSLLKYEFGIVAWKGRNVCLPVMHIVSSLPK